MGAKGPRDIRVGVVRVLQRAGLSAANEKVARSGFWLRRSGRLSAPQLDAKVHLNGAAGRRETDERAKRRNTLEATTKQQQSIFFGRYGGFVERIRRCLTYSYRPAHWRGWWPGGPSPSTDAPVSVATSSDRSIMTS